MDKELLNLNVNGCAKAPQELCQLFEKSIHVAPEVAVSQTLV